MNRRCLWCLSTVPAGWPRICSAHCFNLARWFGWFEPRRLWARQQAELIMAAEDAAP